MLSTHSQKVKWTISSWKIFSSKRCRREPREASKSMLILGLSPFRHHAAAALLQDGVICAAIENDKLLRAHKRGSPDAAISFCLERIGAQRSDLNAIAIATRPTSA